MLKYLIPLVVLLVVGTIIGCNSIYVIQEGKQVIITEFGKPIGEPITDAGLKFKTPFIQRVRTFEKRILEWDGYPNQIPTKDKKFIWLDTTARWRIADALTFYESVGTENMAQSRLDDIIDSAARDLVTSQLLIEVVRNTNRVLEVEIPQVEGEEDQLAQPLERIQTGREKITAQILEKAQVSVPAFGIELIDVQIKRINYVDEVRQKVYSRMISERQRISEKYKSEGEGEAANINGQKQKELQRIQSEAYKESEQIKGQADGWAIQIYADAHGNDPEFYGFLETLETYKATSAGNSKLILSTNSDLYNYLKYAQ